MKKYQRHYIYFWITALLFIFTITSIGRWNQMLTYLILTIVAGIVNYLSYISGYISIDGNIVEGKTGLIHTQKLSSNKSNITSVKVNKGLIGNIFNFGTIEISTASENYKFSFIKNPDELKKEILK